MNIKKISDLDKNSVFEAGGKGSSLGEMMRKGVPVPEGFVVLTRIFEDFMKRNKIQDKIKRNLDRLNIENIEEISKKIQSIILQSKLSSDLSNKIFEKFYNLKSDFVAVRSSATTEDGSSSAWAGQLSTFLNTSEESLLDNIKKCWASIFSERALLYKLERQTKTKNISIAVIVQKMVDADRSGIAFSTDPISQKRNNLIIEAGHGLGEAVVSGYISPDSYIVDKKNMKIIDRTNGKQEKMLARSKEGKCIWKTIENKPKDVLSKKELFELARLVIQIEKIYGFPVDVEWAQEKRKFYITQSRPITTLRKD